MGKENSEREKRRIFGVLKNFWRIKPMHTRITIAKKIKTTSFPQFSGVKPAPAYYQTLDCF